MAIAVSYIKRIATPPYAFAVLTVAGAVGLRLALDPLLGSQSPYLPFVAAVLLTGRLCGRGPALAGTLLSVLSVWYFFLEPHYSFAISSPNSLAGLGLFVVIGAAISLLETRRGQSDSEAAANPLKQRRPAAIGVLLLRRIGMLAGAALTAGVLASTLWTGLQRSEDAERWVEHTYQVLDAAASVRSNLERSQTSERGYLLTGEDEYYDAFQSAVASERQARATLRRLVADNPDELARLNEIDRLTEARLQMSADAIRVRREEGADAVSSPVRNVRGGPLMDQLRATLDGIDQQEHRLLQSRTTAASAADLRSRWILGLGSGSLVALLILAGVSIERQIEERRRTEIVLARQARLIDLSHDAVITADPNRVITGWNLGAQETYGWTEQEAIGRRLHDFLHTDTSASAEIERQMERKDRWEGELYHQRADGRRIVTESRHVLLRDGRGAPVAYLQIARDVTQRKQAEDASRLSEEKFAKAFAINPAAITITRLDDGKFLDVNEAWEAMTGYDRDQAIGRTAIELGIWPDAAARSGFAGELIDKGSLHGSEQTIVRRSGEPFPALVSAATLTIGEEKAILSALLDISQRKRDEEALRESEQQFRTLANAIPQLCWMANPDGWIFWYNDRWYEYTGATPEQMAGWGWQSVHDPQALTAVIARWKLSLANGELFDMVFPLRGADGVFRPFLTRVVPVRGASGKIVRWFGTNTDIGEQRKTEEALRQSEERFRALVMATSDVVYRMSPDWKEMRYLDGRDFIPDTKSHSREWLAKYIHPDDQPAALAVISEAIRDKTIFELEHRAPRSDGSFAWVHSRAVPLFDASGEIVEWFGAASDVTPRKKSEDEIRRLNADLERRVLERTAQLEAANKELESFSYSVSHDLRAPLRGIDGWSQALLEDYCGECDRLDEKGRRYLGRVRSETQRMGRLIDDLLQLSRITRAEMHRDTVDLSVTVASIAARLRELHPERSLEFVIQPGVTALGDARLLDVALTNLLQNAVKFTGTRDRARIEFEVAGSNGNRIFALRDNGVGFDIAYAGTLFGAFQRLHSESEFPGTGIGLATVQRVVHRHGGRIWAEAEPDRGANFYFTLGGEN